MPRSEHLADMTTAGLHGERDACLLLTTDGYAGSDRVKEFHADLADRISDELDRRSFHGAQTPCGHCYATDGHHVQCPHF